MTRVFDAYFAGTPFRWVPVNLKLTAQHPWFYVAIGNSRYLQWNILPDFDERTVAQLGRWYITRPETDQEQSDRCDEEEALACMEADANRYIDWAY